MTAAADTALSAEEVRALDAYFAPADGISEAYIEFARLRASHEALRAALARLEAVAEAAAAFERIPDKWANGDERDALRAALAAAGSAAQGNSQ